MTTLFICNAGSSSLKFSLIEAESQQSISNGIVDWGTAPASLVLQSDDERTTTTLPNLKNHAEAVRHVLNHLSSSAHAPVRVQAVGHRVVHGGTRYREAVLITEQVKQDLRELSELAPLHLPASLQGIEAMQRVLPKAPHVAAFDTAFHATLPEAARTYPVPQRWTRDWGIRRYGFHGLSHAYCAEQAARMLGRRDVRLIIAHLGNGASLSAVRDGECIDTSMGFTPMEGLMMGTRCGNIDPGVLIYLMRTKGLSADDLDRALNYESGLLGVSQVASDMRQVLSAAEHDAAARLAVDIYVHRVQQGIGAMAASLGGVDALIFTAGIGEHAAVIRQRVCQNLEHLSLKLNPEANRACHADMDIAMPTSTGRIIVVATREDLMIARQVMRVLGSSTSAAALP